MLCVIVARRAGITAQVFPFWLSEAIYMHPAKDKEKDATADILVTALLYKRCGRGVPCPETYEFSVLHFGEIKVQGDRIDTLDPKNWHWANEAINKTDGRGFRVGKRGVHFRTEGLHVRNRVFGRIDFPILAERVETDLEVWPDTETRDKLQEVGITEPLFTKINVRLRPNWDELPEFSICRFGFSTSANIPKGGRKETIFPAFGPFWVMEELESRLRKRMPESAREIFGAEYHNTAFGLRETQYDLVMAGNPDHDYSVIFGGQYNLTPPFWLSKPIEKKTKKRPMVFSFTPRDLDFRVQVLATPC